MSRLLIVSNRLPFTLSDNNGKAELQPSSGGLISAFGSFLDQEKSPKGKDCLWIGWPGTYLHGKRQEDFTALALRQFSAFPVWMALDEAAPFYEGFCNGTLWPLFHYRPSMATFHESDWEAYRKANLRFRDAILNILRPGDSVWIQDYQLLLLPRLLREERPSLSIGFFLHIPFPSFEVFRLLPTAWRREILQGMLGSDLIGFHTHDYSQYFLRSVFRTLGHEHALGNLYLEDRVVRVDTFPLGIDYAKFRDAAGEAETLEESETVWKTPPGMKIISSVDRLDYTKGLLHRLRGFEHFLTTHPEWLGQVQLIMIVVPSREEVDQYQKMKRELDETVGQVNGAFGNPQWTPIIYQYRSLPFRSLVALYARTDVALITPLRDGMNLVAKEFVASKGTGTGVLILSEMAGAAQELGEALIVNPNHKSEVAEAIFQALTMPESEQCERLAAMQARLLRNDARHWSDGFQVSWNGIRALREKLLAKHLGSEPRHNLVAHYQVSETRLVLLDYDGTLVPFASHPEKAIPDPKLRLLLRRLAFSDRNRVYLVSGRERDILERWFGDLGVGMIAEHGVWLREPGEDWNLTKPLDRRWKQTLSPILAGYVDRLAGSFVEEKEYSLAWHYRGCNPELASYRAKELVDMLTHFTANMDVQVLEGKKVVEIRCAGVNKGLAAAHCLEKLRPDFIMAIGDDATDEDLFRAMPEDAHTIRVGMTASFADFNLKDYVEVRTLLEEMAAETLGPKISVS